MIEESNHRISKEEAFRLERILSDYVTDLYNEDLITNEIVKEFYHEIQPWLYRLIDKDR